MDNWRPGGTGWMDLDLVGQQSRALVALVPPVSIKDRSLHGVCFRGTQLGLLVRESPFLRDGTA
jgi:hypothetical protein